MTPITTARYAEFRQKPVAISHADMLLHKNSSCGRRVAYRQPHVESTPRNGFKPESFKQHCHGLAPERIGVARTGNSRVRLTVGKHLAQELLKESAHPAGSQSSAFHDGIDRVTWP